MNRLDSERTSPARGTLAYQYYAIEQPTREVIRFYDPDEHLIIVEHDCISVCLMVIVAVDDTRISTYRIF